MCVSAEQRTRFRFLIVNLTSFTLNTFHAPRTGTVSLCTQFGHVWHLSPHHNHDTVFLAPDLVWTWTRNSPCYPQAFSLFNTLAAVWMCAWGREKSFPGLWQNEHFYGNYITIYFGTTFFPLVPEHVFFPFLTQKFPSRRVFLNL